MKKMGYRFVLRKFTYPSQAEPNGILPFTSWWDNKGVAPCYKPFRLALRIRGSGGNNILPTDADITSWLPGDNLYDSKVYLPAQMTPGQYLLDLAIIDDTEKPRIRLPIEGRLEDGWYQLGKVQIIPRKWKAANR